MRSFVVMAGIVAALTGFWAGCGFWDRSRAKAGEVQRLAADIEGLRQKRLFLEKLPQHAPAPLMQAYVSLVNDMHLLAAAHRVTCAVNVQGSKDADVQKNAVASDLQGVREIPLAVIFSGFARRGTVLSLLDALNGVERALPIVIRSVGYEKDAITLELSVFGL